MDVKTVIRFKDLEANEIREVGEQFSVSKERFNKLSRLGLVEAVIEPQKAEKKLKETAK